MIGFGPRFSSLILEMGALLDQGLRGVPPAKDGRCSK
jgi:hypothetical protein